MNQENFVFCRVYDNPNPPCPCDKKACSIFISNGLEFWYMVDRVNSVAHSDAAG